MLIVFGEDLPWPSCVGREERGLMEWRDWGCSVKMMVGRMMMVCFDDGVGVRRVYGEG